MTNILVEAIYVGIGLVVIGMLIHFISNNFYKHDMNNNTILCIHFFIAGFIVHMLCEYLGINKWYCSNGNACLQK